jgi:hypothetical protein
MLLYTTSKKRGRSKILEMIGEQPRDNVIRVSGFVGSQPGLG